MAQGKGLLSREDLLSVARIAQDELEMMPFVGANAETKKTDRRRELEADVTRVEQALQQH